MVQKPRYQFDWALQMIRVPGTVATGGLEVIYRIEAGPFEEKVARGLIEEAKLLKAEQMRKSGWGVTSSSKQKTPLPGVTSGDPGLYVDSLGGVTRSLTHKKISQAIDVSQADSEAAVIQRAWRKRGLQESPQAGELVPFFGTWMGESGWYKDSINGMVAWFTTGESWELLVGPFEETVLRNVKQQAQVENTLVVLPGTEDGATGYYMTADGTVQHCMLGFDASIDSKPVVQTAAHIKAVMMLQAAVRRWSSRRSEMFGALGTVPGQSGWYSEYRSTTLAWFSIEVVEDGSQDWQMKYGPVERPVITELMEKSKWKVKEGLDPVVLSPGREDIAIDHTGMLQFDFDDGTMSDDDEDD